ncbi:putative tributyrin esterase [Pedobacter sp. UYP30]|uniref:alpha/beta hydrolase n=1 Tax=Pedobacter sp. UYP30 TaxID=1756400 RepID=UPI003393BCD5
MKHLSLLLIATLCYLSTFAQKQLVFNSKNLPRTDTVWVFTPHNMSKHKTLPTVFLLHGFSANYKQWNSIMDAQKYADDFGYILVCPDGLFNSWYINSPAKKDWQYESFFFDELMPKIKTDFPVDTSNVFITGLSMGGHGALYLFLKHPELFKSAGSTSGGVDLTDPIGQFGVPDLLGNPSHDSDIWLQYSVIGNIDKLKGSKKQIIFDDGNSDFFYHANNNLKKKCDSLKINATYTQQPGSHNATYWKKSIKQQFAFFKTIVDGD